MNHMNKRIFAALAAGLLSLSLLTACGRTQNSAASGSTSAPVWVESDQWPDNEFTQQIPTPEFGAVSATAEGQSQDQDYFCVSLREVTQEEAEGYAQILQDEGFELLWDKTETPKGGSVVLAFVFEQEEVGVSLSFSGDTMGLYIARPQAAT